jgi:hypothetical protein
MAERENSRMAQEQVEAEGEKTKDHDFRHEGGGDDMRTDQKNQEGDPHNPVVGFGTERIRSIHLHFPFTSSFVKRIFLTRAKPAIPEHIGFILGSEYILGG